MDPVPCAAVAEEISIRVVRKLCETIAKWESEHRETARIINAAVARLDRYSRAKGEEKSARCDVGVVRKPAPNSFASLESAQEALLLTEAEQLQKVGALGHRRKERRRKTVEGSLTLESVHEDLRCALSVVPDAQHSQSQPPKRRLKAARVAPDHGLQTRTSPVNGAHAPLSTLALQTPKSGGRVKMVPPRMSSACAAYSDQDDDSQYSPDASSSTHAVKTLCKDVAVCLRDPSTASCSDRVKQPPQDYGINNQLTHHKDSDIASSSDRVKQPPQNYGINNQHKDHKDSDSDSEGDGPKNKAREQLSGRSADLPSAGDMAARELLERIVRASKESCAIGSDCASVRSSRRMSKDSAKDDCASSCDEEAPQGRAKRVYTSNGSETSADNVLRLSSEELQVVTPTSRSRQKLSRGRTFLRMDEVRKAQEEELVNTLTVDKIAVSQNKVRECSPAPDGPEDVMSGHASEEAEVEPAQQEVVPGRGERACLKLIEGFVAVTVAHAWSSTLYGLCLLLPLLALNALLAYNAVGGGFLFYARAAECCVPAAILIGILVLRFFSGVAGGVRGPICMHMENHAKLHGFYKGWLRTSLKSSLMLLAILPPMLLARIFLHDETAEGELTVGIFVDISTVFTSFCLAYTFDGLELIADHFCIRFYADPCVPIAIQTWDMIQILMRKISRAVDMFFLIFQTAVMVSYILVCAEVIFGDGKGLRTKLLLSKVPSALLMLFCAWKAARVTERCKQVPAVLNSINVDGRIINHDKQYLVNHIAHSEAGFHVMGSRVEMFMVLKMVYCMGVISFACLPGA